MAWARPDLLAGAVSSPLQILLEKGLKLLEQDAELVLDRGHLEPQAVTVLVFSERVPDGEDPVGEHQRSLPELLLGGQALAMEPEISL